MNARGTAGIDILGMLLVGLLPHALPGPAAAQENEPAQVLQAGFAAQDITPPQGAGMPGMLHKRGNSGVADPLFVVAGVFTDGATAVAVVGVDALCITRATVEAARTAIASATPIPAAHVLVGASHTHNGGPIRPLNPEDADQAYMDRVTAAIVAAVERAWREREPVQIGIGSGHEEAYVFNRRFLMRDGREITHPGRPGTARHHLIVRPAGPIDPEVGVLAARTPDGTVKGIIVNYACHATVMGGGKVSADYIGALRRHLHEKYASVAQPPSVEPAQPGAAVPHVDGPHVDGPQVVFLLGTCGDVTQVNNRSNEREFGPEHCDRVGGAIAAEAIRTIERMEWLNTLSIASATEMVTLTIRPEPDVDRERPAFGLGSGPEEYFARERQALAEERERSRQEVCEVQAIRIGPLGIVTNGSEFFCADGLRIKEASPLKPTWVSTLTNEWLGYIPTASAFVAGGYEPRTRRGSRFAIDSAQLLVEASLKALKEVAEEEGGN
jgi:neutral ceramidase